MFNLKQKATKGDIYSSTFSALSIDCCSGLHDSIGWASRALGHRPPDELWGSLNGAAFAVHAVLCVDNEVAVPSAVCLGVFVDAGRTKSLFWPVKYFDGNA